MLFNSWGFVWLVIITCVLYYLPFLKKMQIYILLLASMVFYAYDFPDMLILLLLSGLINAFASYGARYWKYPRASATIGVILNLSILIMFKYGGLFATSFLNTNEGIGALLCSLPLPLGISFYTFSGISLVIDTYKGKLKSTHQNKTLFEHIRNTFLYILFFPKLLAGPIAKADSFFKEINGKHFHDIDWKYIFKALIVGYFLKMVIADNLKDFTFWMPIRYCEHMWSGNLLLMMFGYSIQMFADFAGYSLIAIGIAKLFGYKLPDNFNFPYISSSFHEFWKRWHITLSNFLMEYLYISLGGNRKGKIRTYLNLLLTMMLGGLWHGAAWSYLVWGTYHGLCLSIERLICGKRPDILKIGRGNSYEQFTHIISIIFVFTSVSIGWLFFKLPIGEAARYILHIFTNINSNYIAIDNKLLPIFCYIVPVFIYHAMYAFRNNLIINTIISRYSYILYGTMLFLILTNSGSAIEFVYFQF